MSLRFMFLFMLIQSNFLGTKYYMYTFNVCMLFFFFELAKCGCYFILLNWLAGLQAQQRAQAHLSTSILLWSKYDQIYRVAPFAIVGKCLLRFDNQD